MRQLIFKGFLVLVFLAGCSADEGIDTQTENETINEKPEEKEDDSGFGIHFLTTLTNYFGRDQGTLTYRSASLAGTWAHEYDDNNRLLKSLMYEKFPFRLLKEIHYSDYSSDDLEMNLEIINYTYFYGFPRSFTINYRLRLHPDLSADRLIADGGNSYLSFEELNAEGYVTKLGDGLEEDQKLWTTHFEYDTQGNHTKYYAIYYNSGITNASVDYTYNELGDLKTYDFQNEAGSFSKVDCFYRSDNSLERLEEIFDMGDGYAGNKTFYYDEQEVFTSKLINFEDGSKIIESYTNEQIIEKHLRPGDILQEVWKYRITGNDIYIQLIEYYDGEGNLEYTEYYDENGNLEETVYE